jgi:hypothetical protein
MGILVLILCAVAVFTQSRKRQRVPAQSQPAIITIHQIDFKNYVLPLNGKYYKLIDGFYAENVAPNTQWGLEMADGPYFGDLTGDKKEEVAFILRYGTIGAPQTAETRVYTLQNGQPSLLATFPVAGEVNCTLDHYMNIEDGTISVERIYSNGAQCDHNEITQYRWNGKAFMPVGNTKRAACRCM